VTAERILVTGLGGAVGVQLARQLTGLANGTELVAVFSSARSRRRFLDLAEPDLCAVLQAEVCDLTDERQTVELGRVLGRAEQTLAVHAAANTSWTLPLADALRANVYATRNLAQLVRDSSVQARMVYVSSAFTAPEGWTYRNTYEQSKALAERLLRAEYPDLDPSVFSCSLVVGHSRTGEITRFHGLYPLLRVLDGYEVPAVPGDRAHRLDIVPVDWVADELLRLLVELRGGGPARDVVAAAGDAAPTMQELVERAVAVLNRHRMRDGRGPLPEVAVLTMRQWEFLRRSLDAWQVSQVPMPNPRVLDRVLAAYRPYLLNGRVLPPSGTASRVPLFAEYLDGVVSYWSDSVRRRDRVPSPA